MKIAIISSVLNEIKFIESYIIQNINYVDEILLSDGGSTDGTLDIINKYIDKGYNIKLFHHTQGKPYTDEWNHDKVLNNLIENTKADFIMQIDVDELLHDSFYLFHDIVRFNPQTLCYGLKLITFWGSKDKIRINVENDNHWYGTYKYCIFKNISEIRFKGANHAILTYNNDNIFKYNYKYIDIPLLHLHYLTDILDSRLKPNDNRLHDVGGDYLNPDFNIQKSNWRENPFNYSGEYKIETIETSKIFDDLLHNLAIETAIQNIIDQYIQQINKLNIDNDYYIKSINAYKEVVDSLNL